MTWAFDLADAIDLAALAGSLWLIPAAFAAGFVLRLERWYRPLARLVEAIRARIAEGEGP